MCCMGDMAHMAGTSDALVTNSPRSKRARAVNFREIAGVISRRPPGAGARAAEQALALLVSGEVSSQNAAAAALGISKGQLSVAKTHQMPPHFKFNQQPTERVTVCEVTYTKELSCGDERLMPLAEKKARAARNYRRKMAALREAARRGSEADTSTTAGGADLVGAEQSNQQTCAGLDEAEMGCSEHELDGAEGELTELGGAEAALWEQLEALNGWQASACDTAFASGAASHGALTRQILGHDHGPVERRTRSHEPHEWAALTPAQRLNTNQHNTACVCARCGASRGFDVELGRAHSLQDGSCAMYGANDFMDHEVSCAVLMAEDLMDTHGWRGAIAIPRCHRCVFELALTGSAARSEVAALFVWRQELDLNLAVTRVTASALRLPYVEPAPELYVDTGSGAHELRLGKASVFVVLSKEDALLGCKGLRRLWYSALTPELLEGYKPLVVDEKLVINTAAEAVAMGTERRAVGQEWAEHAAKRGEVMLVIVEAEPEGHRAAAAAATALREGHGSTMEHVDALRKVLRECAGTSLILLPSGAGMNADTEALANRAEAQALGLSPEALSRSRFDRTGAASGIMDAEHVVERLGQSSLVQSEAARKWGSEVEFLAPTDCTGGVRSAAMSYIASEKARPRARKGKGSSDTESQRLSLDGPNQPRLKRVCNSVRGAHLQAKELQVLERNSGYMERVRLPQMQNACDCLLTLRHHGFGGAPLGARACALHVHGHGHHTYGTTRCVRPSGNSSSSPIAKATSTMVRVIKECGSIAGGVAYMARNTITSFNIGALPVHVDGVKGAREPTAELCTTRWAAALRHLSTENKVAELAAARVAQPLLAMSVWLRHGLSLDVAPASGLAIASGTEEEHGVPEPLPDAGGRDLERGFTRSLAQSLRPDEATTDDAPCFDVNYQRRPGMRPRHATDGPRQAAGTGRTHQATHRPHRSEAARAAPNRLDPGRQPQPVQPQGAVVRRRDRRGNRTGLAF